jgi:hypothetical protein
MWPFVFVHILCERNANIDWLAKLTALLLDEPKIFSIYPSLYLKYIFSKLYENSIL